MADQYVLIGTQRLKGGAIVNAHGEWETGVDRLLDPEGNVIQSGTTAKLISSNDHTRVVSSAGANYDNDYAIPALTDMIDILTSVSHPSGIGYGRVLLWTADAWATARFVAVSSSATYGTSWP